MLVTTTSKRLEVMREEKRPFEKMRNVDQCDPTPDPRRKLGLRIICERIRRMQVDPDYLAKIKKCITEVSDLFEALTLLVKRSMPGVGGEART